VVEVVKIVLKLGGYGKIACTTLERKKNTDFLTAIIRWLLKKDNPYITTI